MDALRLIPLGGYGEIGKNSTLLELSGQFLLIDAGIAFPNEDDPLGADLLMPDLTYLRERADQLAGIVLTHGHEDHVGGLPYVLRYAKAPIYASMLTCGLVKSKLGQHKLDGVPLNVVEAGMRYQVGPFDIEAIRVTHSIPDCLALAIRTPFGTVVHSGDFKFDHTPIDGRATDFSALARLGDEGVRLLISDTTNIDRAGHTPSEAVVGPSFERIFATTTGRIFVATFASQIHRIQQVIDVAERYGRRVLVAGRSMERFVSVARQLGYLHIADATRVTATEANALPPEQLVVLITGSQGEPVSGLSRLSRGKHAKLRMHAGDTVILSARPIPGNEALVWRLINDLMRSGANVVDHRQEMVHVSGHASREELALLFNLVRPEYAVPFHGEYRHMIAYGELAQDVGLSHENVFLLQNGDVLRLDAAGAHVDPPVPHGTWCIEGSRVNEAGANDAVVQDRQFLADSGVITAAVAWDFAAGQAIVPPVVSVRGVRVRLGDEALPACLADAAERLAAHLADLDDDARVSFQEVERAAKRFLRSYFQVATGTYPVMQVLVAGGPTDAASAEVTAEP